MSGPKSMTGFFTVITILCVWEGTVAVSGVPQYLLPAPTAIVSEFLAKWDSLGRHALVTLLETLAGFSLAALAGSMTGLLVVTAPGVRKVIYPLLVALQAVPKVALAPLLLIWLGFGLGPKVLVAALMAYFPVVVAMANGLSAIDARIIAMARTMGATRTGLFLQVQLPGALPFLFGGLKVAASLSVVGAVVGEFVGADRGLGYLLLVANGTLNTRFLFASLLVLCALGLFIYYGLEVLEARLLPWHRVDGRNGRTHPLEQGMMFR